MPEYKKKYSRGNNDGTERIYQTAVIEVALILNSECQQEGDECVGEVSAKVKYKATASTEDPMFRTSGPNFALRDGGQGGNSAQLQHTVNPPPDTSKNDTLEAELDLAPIPCAGGKLRGTIDVEIRPPGAGFSGVAAQRITYDIEISDCGQIQKSEIDAEELYPTTIFNPNRLPTPLLPIPPPEGAPQQFPPHPGYPPHPGVPRPS